MRVPVFIALVAGCFGAEKSSSERISHKNGGFCDGKPNGHHPTGASCSSEMNVCVAGQLVNRVQCPFNLVFDEIYQRCDNPANVASCGRRSSHTDEKYDYPNAYGSCLFDGYSSISNCSTSFVRCEDGVPELFECTNDKVYDRVSGQCVESYELDECSDLRSEKDEKFAANKPTLKRKKSLDESRNIYSCVKREDGLYSLGCESQFLTCSGGVSRVMRCPVDLIYNNITEACDHPVNVIACADILAVNSGNANADVCDSASSAEWFEVNKCSPLFFTCRQGEKVQLACPSSLIFSAETLRCEYRHNVTGCQEFSEESPEESVETGKLPNEVEKSDSDGKSESDRESTKKTFSKTTTSAGKLPSEDKESSGEIFADFGKSFEESSGLSSDQYEEYSQASFSGFEDFSGKSSGEISEESFSGLFVDSKSFDESRESSGQHGSGEFSGEGSGFVIEEGSSELFAQSSGLKFIESSGDGLLQEFSGSEGSILIESSSSGFSGDSFSGGDQTVEVSELSATDAKDCINKRDGFYGQGCSSRMVACVNGMPTPMACPAKLKYEEKKQICDFSPNVVACSKKVSNETADEIIDAITTIDNGINSESVHRLKRSLHKHNDSSSLLCHNRKDGRSSFGCEESFLSCHQGHGRVMKCKTGNTLEEKLQKCVPLELHSTCFQLVHLSAERDGGKVAILNVNGEQEAVGSGDESSGESSGEDSGQTDGRNEQVSQFSCDKDGYFAKTICSPSYVHCYRGKPCEMKCDHGHVYSSSVQMCLRLAEMPECLHFLALPDGNNL